jgi:hypothetical protein
MAAAVGGNNFGGLDEQQRTKIFTYDILNQVYPAQDGLPARTTQIPIQTLPSGALMHNYFTFPNRDAGEGDLQFTNRLLAIFLSRYGINCVYDPNDITVNFCFSRIRAKYQFYYPNPCAGFGVQGWGTGFNTGLVCTTKRTTRWAYLKSGTKVPNAVVNHRKYAPAGAGNPAYDQDRLRICDRYRDRCHYNPGIGENGNNWDICMTPEFMVANQVDGITAIAGEDDLMDITRNDAGYVFDTRRKTMYTAINNWIRAKHDHGNIASDQLLYAMNLLCLETDYIPSNVGLGKIAVGFREFNCPPSGWREPTDANIPPAQLPAATYGQDGIEYAIENQWDFSDGRDNLVGRKFKFPATLAGIERIANFIREYVTRHTIMRPVCMFTPHGRLAFDPEARFPFDEAQIGALAAPGFNMQQLNDLNQYNLNRRIGEWYAALQPLSHLYFDFRLNVFFYTAPGMTNISHPFQINFHNELGDSIIGLNLFTCLINNNINLLQLFKIAHEIISNRKWDNWMNIIIIAGNRYQIPSGPFYNSLSLPIANYDNMPSVYLRILEELEAGVPAAGQSWSRQNLNVVGLTNWMNNWNHTIVGNIGNNDVPFRSGIFFPVLRANAAFTNLIIPNRVQQGGFRRMTTYRKLRGGQLKTLRRVRNVRMGNLKKLNRTKKQTFLTNKRFQANLASGLRSISNRSTRNTPAKIQNMSSNSNTTTESTPPLLHTSPNASEMSKDTFDTLKTMFADPAYSKIFGALFDMPDAKDMKPVKIDNQFTQSINTDGKNIQFGFGTTKNYTATNTTSTKSSNSTV